MAMQKPGNKAANLNRTASKPPLDASVGGVADTDSMFNDADPQAAKIGPSGAGSRARNQGEQNRPKNTKTA